MNFNNNQSLYNFLVTCITKNITFSDQDYYNFSKACNIKADMNYAMEYLFDTRVTSTAGDNTSVVTKSLLGPCYVHPKGTNPKSVNYNISKIIQELKLNRQNISPDEKLKKITDYIELLG
jgi:hypothetical protein